MNIISQWMLEHGLRKPDPKKWLIITTSTGSTYHLSPENKDHKRPIYREGGQIDFDLVMLKGTGWKRKSGGVKYKGMLVLGQSMYMMRFGDNPRPNWVSPYATTKIVKVEELDQDREETE